MIEFQIMDKSFFTGKKITLMGLGLLGRGVGDAKWLAEQGAILTITDLKSEKELATSIKKLTKFKNIKYVLGRHSEKDFISADLVIKSAGVPQDSKFLKVAQKNKVPIFMSTALFAKMVPEGVKIIGITGTRGKSTTTHLIYHLLKSAGKRVLLGGNVRGMSTLALLDKVQSGDHLVLELDSWQLQGFGDLKISPQVSVFTTFMPDHLNYYKGRMDKYFKDKANIYRWQKKNDLLIAGHEVAPLIKKNLYNFKGCLLVIKDKNIPKSERLIGKHNKLNIALAFAVGRKLGLSTSELKSSLKTFPGVSGRLEFLGEKRKIRFYNDTTATTPEATLSALKSFPKNKVILIAGGSDKGLDYKNLVKIIPRQVKSLIFLPGRATDKIISILPKKFNFFTSHNMAQAVKKAFSLAKPGDVILLSPAAASFGLFKNEFDRGDKFISEVERVK